MHPTMHATDPLFTPPSQPKAAGLTRAFLRLKKLAQRREHHLRLGTMLKILGQDGLLALNALLCMLNIVLSPLQGVSLPLGFMQLMIMTALLRGRKTFWLPRKWQVRPFQAETLIKHLNKWLPRLYTLESISQPRMRRVMQNKHVYRTTLWLLWFIAFIIACPIPFMNVTPALAGLFLSLGLINRDGWAWITGLLITLAHSSLYFFWEAFYPRFMAVLHAWYS